MTDGTVERGRHYPQMPPALDGETNEAYTNRLTGADRTDRVPYDHQRNRQCSIGWHEECSDRSHSGKCQCPCHQVRRMAKLAVAEWNVRCPVGTRVEFIAGADEPPVATTGPATFDPIGGSAIGGSAIDGWPVVPLDTFDRPVELSWLVVR